MNSQVFCSDPWEARPQPRTGLGDPKTWYPSPSKGIMSLQRQKSLFNTPARNYAHGPWCQTASPISGCTTLSKSFSPTSVSSSTRCAL